MTTARLVSNPADGHGLIQRITDPLFHKLANDEDVDAIPCVVLLKPVGHGSRNTANGRKQFVQFEVARIEPVTDAHDADQVRHMITAAWDRRHNAQTLPLDWPNRNDDDQRRHLLALVDEWAAEEGLTTADVKERWRTQWGIEGDEPSSDGAFAHPDIDKAAVHHIKEFCYMVGVLADTPEDSADADADADGAS